MDAAASSRAWLLAKSAPEGRYTIHLAKRWERRKILANDIDDTASPTWRSLPARQHHEHRDGPRKEDDPVSAQSLDAAFMVWVYTPSNLRRSRC